MFQSVLQLLGQMSDNNHRSAYLVSTEKDESGKTLAERAGAEVISHIVAVEKKHQMALYLFAMVKAMQPILSDPREIDLARSHENFLHGLINRIDRYLLSFELVEPEDIHKVGLMETGAKLLDQTSRYLATWEKMKVSFCTG